MSDDDSISVGLDFRGDAPPATMAPYRDGVLNEEQQSILNELRIDLCRENLIYLNNHKEVEAIATLLLKEIIRKTPKNPYAHAARYLSDPRTADRVANFALSDELPTDELLDRDAKMYSTVEAVVAMNECNLEPTTTEDRNERRKRLFGGLLVTE